MIRRVAYKALDRYMNSRWKAQIERTEMRSVRAAKSGVEAEGNASLALVKAGANTTDIETLIKRVEKLEKSMKSNGKSSKPRTSTGKKAS